MAAIFRDYDGHTEDDNIFPENGLPMICFACGKPPDAFCDGPITTAICRECAIAVLPGMIADAVGSRFKYEPKILPYEDTESKIMIYYWKAVAMLQASIVDRIFFRDHHKDKSRPYPWDSNEKPG